MRLLVSLVLSTLVASAFAQEYPTAQIEAVNDLPNVDVQLVDENTFTAVSDAAEETAAVVVSAINDAVETVAESLTLDAPVTEDEAVALELDEVVEEEPAPVLEVAEEETVVVDEVVEEVVEEDPAPTLEVVEEEVSEVDETVPEDEPMLQPVRTETAAPDPAEMEDDEPALDPETPTLTVAEPEPEPTTTDTQGDAAFVAKPELVTPMDEVTVEAEKPSKPTKKELKAVEKFNAAVDNIAKILSQRLSEKDALPLAVDEEVLEVLNELPPTTLPPTTTSTTTEAAPVEPEESKCPAKWVDKCLTDKCKGKPKCLDKCMTKGCATEKKKIKKGKNKKNKNNKRKSDKENKDNKKTNKNNKNKKNKNKNNKNNKKNRIKNIRNKLFRTPAGRNRQSKDLEFEDTEDLDEVMQGRRKGEDTTKEKTSKVKKGNNKRNKNKNNKRNKNTNQNRSEDLPAEAKDKYIPKSAETGPLFASLDEFSAFPAMIMGFSHIRREGDVQVDLSGKHARFVANIVMGPLNVLLTRPKSSLSRSEVTTELRGQMSFTAKEARRRDKLSINEVVVEIPDDESVSVLRSDLDLEPDVVSTAQAEVSSAIDTDRVARIIHQTLAKAFEEDNIMQNLEDHPALMAKEGP